MNDTTATLADLDRHAESVRAGFASMAPAPRRFTNPNPQPAPADTVETPAPAAPVESTTHRVVRESGLVGTFELTLTPQADITGLTKTILTKAEKTKLAEINEACDRLGAEIHKAGLIPKNPNKVAAAWAAEHPGGEPVPQDIIETASRGDELRSFAKTTAKAAALAFFQDHARPLIFTVFEKAADSLREAIVERVKLEREAFEKFAELYHDGDAVAYRPSPGVVRMMSRRRALLDQELFFTSPPSVKAALEGIYAS